MTQQTRTKELLSEFEVICLMMEKRPSWEAPVKNVRPQQPKPPFLLQFDRSPVIQAIRLLRE